MKADYAYLNEDAKYGPFLPTTPAQDVETNIREAEAEGVRVLTAFDLWDESKSAPKWERFSPLESEIPQVRDAWRAVQSARTLRKLLKMKPDALEIVLATMNMDSHYFATICFPHMRNAVAKPSRKKKESAFKKPVLEAIKTHTNGTLFQTVEKYLKIKYGATKEATPEGGNPEAALIWMGGKKIKVSALREEISRCSRL